MIRFVIRRTAQMIPTLIGVIVVTFVLFHVVGGSPALIKLGKNASPRALEEFDEQRGFNKPLFFGWRVPTRAWPDHDLKRHAGPWAGVPRVAHDLARGQVVFSTNEVVALPFAFPLRAGTRYEISATLRPPGKSPPVSLRFEIIGGKEDAILQRLGGEGDPVVLEHLSVRRRVENPFDSQFFFYLRQLLRGDLGFSSSQNLPVARILRDGILPTLCLTIPILLGQTVLALVLALLCGYRRGGLLDRGLLWISTVLMSVNYLVWIVAGQYVLGFKWGWFPVWGFASWTYLLLPVGIGIFSGLGSELRFYRSVVLDEMYRDYVRTAAAKGARPARILFHHVLPNVMIPVITNVVLSLPFLYTGSLLLESFFGIPGLGYLGVNAINDADVDVVRAIVVIGSLLYLAANLAADLLYAWADPRVRLS